MLSKVVIMLCVNSILLYNVFAVENTDAQIVEATENDTRSQMSKRQKQYSFDSLRFDKNYVFNIQSKLKELGSKQAFEKQLAKDRELKQKIEENNKKMKTLEEKIYREALLSRVSGSVLRDFNGRFF